MILRFTWPPINWENIPCAKAIAEVIGRRLGIAVVAKSGDEAAEHFGWFAMFVGADLATSSTRTRAVLDWMPTGPDLLTDIDQPGYYAHP